MLVAYLPVMMSRFDESHVIGLHRVLDIVGRAKRYLAFLQAPNPAGGWQVPRRLRHGDDY